MRVSNRRGETEKAGCLVLDEARRVLLIGAPAEGYGLPKGHVKPGESGRQAAARECLEETGWRVELEDRLQDVRCRSRKSGRPARIKLYRARPLRHLGNGSERSQWVALEDALALVQERYLDALSAALAAV